MEIREFQDLMRRTYGDKDAERGIASTIAWLTEELGELAQAVRKGTHDDITHELGDVIAWTMSLANQVNVSMDDAVARYVDGCPRCGSIPCRC